uniref:DNA transfer protein n=1 Tax=viral metagenome TaxID=1070528 RepID=A0A6M3INH5_9ZZZZ
MAIGVGLGLLLGGIISGGSALLGSKGASDAAGIQADAAARAQEKSIEAQLQMFYQSREDLQPWTEAGKIALGRLFGSELTDTYGQPRNALSLTQAGGVPGQTGGDMNQLVAGQPGFTDQELYVLKHENEEWAIDQYTGSNLDPKRIRDRQTQTLSNALTTIGQSPAQTAPTAGEGAAPVEGEIDRYLRSIGELTPENYVKSPGYDFLLEQGVEGIERGAAHRGKLLGGQTQKALMGYGQELGKTDYGNWLNQGYRAAGARMDPFMQTLGYGANAAGANAGNALASGQNQSNTYLQTIPAAGQARAAGVMGQANTLANLGNWGGEQLLNYALMNRTNNALTAGKTFSSGGNDEWLNELVRRGM